jgi:hypothetical protein
MIEALKMRPGEIFPASGEIILNESIFERAEGKFMAKKVTVYSQPG